VLRPILFAQAPTVDHTVGAAHKVTRPACVAGVIVPAVPSTDNQLTRLQDRLGSGYRDDTADYLQRESTLARMQYFWIDLVPWNARILHIEGAGLDRSIADKTARNG
jgi:hypothetical protein